jgi:hypothetical protein
VLTVQDRSRVKVDTSGSGGDFVTAQMIDNGDAVCAGCRAPDGTKCAGGDDKNLCLVSFVTTVGYGNCVVVTKWKLLRGALPLQTGERGRKIRGMVARRNQRPED